MTKRHPLHLIKAQIAIAKAEAVAEYRRHMELMQALASGKGRLVYGEPIKWRVK